MIERRGDLVPSIHPLAWVHEQALLIGDVSVEEGASIWPFVVLRGDMGPIRIGRNSNIQDGTIGHDTLRWESTDAAHPGSITQVGERVTVGHRVILHGCTVGNDVLVGMGSILLDNVVVGDECLIGAGTLLLQGTVIPPGSMVVGSPGRVLRPIGARERSAIQHAWRSYLELHQARRGAP